MAGMARFAQIAAELKIADPAEINALRERLSLLARQISSFIQENRSGALVLPPTSHTPPPVTLKSVAECESVPFRRTYSPIPCPTL